MTPLQAAAINYLRTVPRANSTMISADLRNAGIRHTRPQLTDALIGLSQAGTVKAQHSGWYRLKDDAKAGAV